MLHLVRERRHASGASCAERMPECDRATASVHKVGVDTANRLRATELFVGKRSGFELLQSRKHLRGERLVHLDQIDVIEGDAGAIQRGRNRVRGTDQQLTRGVDRGIRVGADERFGRQAQRLRATLRSPSAGANANAPFAVWLCAITVGVIVQ